MTLSKGFIKIDVIFDDNESAKVSTTIISKIIINFNKDELALIITILKITINFNKNEFVFMIIILKESDIDNFD